MRGGGGPSVPGEANSIFQAICLAPPSTDRRQAAVQTFFVKGNKMAAKGVSGNHPSPHIAPGLQLEGLQKSEVAVVFWGMEGGKGQGWGIKVFFIIKHKNRAVALIFLVETIIGCSHFV